MIYPQKGAFSAPFGNVIMNYMTKEKKIIGLLLLALFFLPAAATLIHFKIHAKVLWLPYLTLFDAVVVTTLFCFKRTAVYAFFLNTIFVIVGIGFHLKFLPGGWSDIMISLTDLFLGYVLYVLVTREKEEKPRVELTGLPRE